MGHFRTTDRRHQLCTPLDDAAVLGFRSNHESCHVMQKHDRQILLVAKADEIRAFVGFRSIDDRRLIRYDTDGHTCEMSASLRDTT